MPTPTVLVDSLMFPEGPRWHEGALWLSDMHAHQVVRIDMSGDKQVVCEVPEWPSGLGWLPDGSLILVSMRDRTLRRLTADGKLALHADLSGVAGFHCNDMVVDGNGNAYVGNFGFDLHNGGTFTPAQLALARPNGDVSVAAEDMAFPNGSVITPDGKTLIVGESAGRRLTAFDIAEGGTLSNRRTWAELSGPPDGICLDAEGCIWVAVPRDGTGCIRVAEGGEVKEQISTAPFEAFACMLGGPEGRTLFICEAKQSDPKLIEGPSNGRITMVEVSVPRAGYP
ncbi:MAG: SMP-30/gluconolactonase/LRE family protein [Dehalococcoidia bacterium]|nr:SMP-30/gluconolactonase/LRE family protein [Dehalococcoidia bacterium]